MPQVFFKVKVNLYFYAILHTIPKNILSVYHRCFIYRIFIAFFFKTHIYHVFLQNAHLSRFSSKRTFITFFFKTHIYHMLFYTKCIFKWAMMRFGNSNSDILKILSLISLFILHCLVPVEARKTGAPWCLLKSAPVCELLLY